MSTNRGRPPAKVWRGEPPEGPADLGDLASLIRTYLDKTELTPLEQALTDGPYAVPSPDARRSREVVQRARGNGDPVGQKRDSEVDTHPRGS